MRNVWDAHHSLQSIACGSREYSGSVLLSDVPSPLREYGRRPPTSEWRDGCRPQMEDWREVQTPEPAGRRWRMGVTGAASCAEHITEYRTYRPKASGSALLSDAPPPPREEQTQRAGGHAATLGRADRRAPDTRPAGAGDGPPPTPHP